ncbi:baculoviral IAP repeat-containing protein 7 [Choloepus didactylus]|uniref:baculoviral IAP repeat-containing protein 7 n=1 Tax=Choloepus didactylus TaxID=27675 RepID=UPI00189F8680|nr:baculoviral IAP repeat-containing protein 7 [Choloepus didactylus]
MPRPRVGTQPCSRPWTPGGSGCRGPGAAEPADGYLLSSPPFTWNPQETRWLLASDKRTLAASGRPAGQGAGSRCGPGPGARGGIRRDQLHIGGRRAWGRDEQRPQRTWAGVGVSLRELLFATLAECQLPRPCAQLLSWQPKHLHVLGHGSLLPPFCHPWGGVLAVPSVVLTEGVRINLLSPTSPEGTEPSFVSRSCAWLPVQLGAAHRLPCCPPPRGPRAAQPWEGSPQSGPSPTVPRGSPCSCGLERDLPGSPVTRPPCREHVRPAGPPAPSRRKRAPAVLPDSWALPHLGHLVGRTLVPTLIFQLFGAEAATTPREGQGLRSPEASRPGTFQSWLSGAPVPAVDPARAAAFFMGPKDRGRCSCQGPGHSCCAEIRGAPRGTPAPGTRVGSPLARGGRDTVDGQILGWLRPLAEEGEEQREEGAAAMWPLGPALPEMGSPERRLASFSAWPPTAAVPPAQLAAAGFFHTGQQDKVRCFFCYGGLQSWEQGDDPWAEHATWFPRCEFLLRSKGRDFVRSVQDSLSCWGPVEEPEGAAPAAPSAPVHGGSALRPPRGETQPERPGEPGVDAEEQLRRLREERMCRVCLDRTVSIVFVPCGHLACADCAPSLRPCPLCRAPIGSRVRTFLS